MARKQPCSPFITSGNCCLTDLEFIKGKDITTTTDIFVVLDSSGSFDAQRLQYVTQITEWYTNFRTNNLEYIGNVYFYPSAYDVDEKMQHYWTVDYEYPMVGLAGSLLLESYLPNRIISTEGEPDHSVSYTFRVSTSFGDSEIITASLANNWNDILSDFSAKVNLISKLNAEVKDGTLIIRNERLSSSFFNVDYMSSGLIVSDMLRFPCVTKLVADGVIVQGNPSSSGYTTNEGWLSLPKIINELKPEFVDLGFKSPDEILLIYIGDESAVKGAYYHGPVYIKENNQLDRDDNITGLIVEDTAPFKNYIQSTALSHPYKDVVLDTWGLTTVGGGYVEHYNEFVNRYYKEFSFFRGIVYGVSNTNMPYVSPEVGSRFPFHSHIYQAIEPTVVSNEDFIESTFALDLNGNTTGLSLAFIKKRNYLAEAGYGGLKNYGWSELHDIGYGADVTSYFTPELFQLNIDRALTSGTKYILRGTLSNGTKIESNEIFVGGAVKASPTDITAGTLSEKIVAGDNIEIKLVNDKIVVSSTSDGTCYTTRNITTTIPSLGIATNTLIPTGTSFDKFVEDLVAPYTRPSFTAFTVNFNVNGNVEVGTPVTVTNATWSTGNDSAGNRPTNISITGTGYNPVTLITASPTTTNSTPTTTVKTTATSEGWSINGLDAKSDNVSRSFNKTWQYMHRFGASPLLIDISNAQSIVDALNNNALSTGKARTVTCTALNNNPANYTYIAYDAAYGNLAGIIQDGASPVLTAFELMGDFAYTNANGVVRTLRVYKSNAKGAFSNSVKLALS